MHRFALPLLCRLAFRTYVPGANAFARPTLRRLAIMTLFIPCLTLLLLLHWIGFAIDEVLYPGYRRVVVKNPVFIVGVPRSGTTVLQRALAVDEATTTFTAWELLFAPSIVERKLLRLAARGDALIGAPCRRLVSVAERHVFGAFDVVHPIRLLAPEEDAFLLFLVLGSIYLFVPFPFPEELWHLVRFDTDTPKARRDRIMKFYRRCVQKHLYVHGPDKRFLSKNPTFTPMIESINAAFPDARVICCMRTPFAVVPSVVSLLTIPWLAFANGGGANEFRNRVLELLDHWYRYPLQRLGGWPESRYTILMFDALIADPFAAVESIYRRFGFTMDDRFARALAALREREGRYRSAHRYSLAQFSLTPSEIVARYRDVFARLDFPLGSGSAEEGEAREADAEARC